MRSVFTYIERWFQTGLKYLISKLVFHVIICIITCLVCKTDVFETFGSTKSWLYALLMANVWSGVFNSITLLFGEADHVMDELSKFLNVRVYIIANVLIQALVCIAEAILCTAVIGVAFGYPTDGVTALGCGIEYILTFFMVLFSADMLAFAIGCALRKVETIMTAVPLLLIMQLLFSGCLYELNGRLMKTVASLTTAKWGFNALGTVSDLNGLLPEGAPIDAAFEYTAGNLRMCWLMLLALSVVCVFAAGFLLYLRVNSEERH